HKKFLIQAAACNLALLMRSTHGSGKPRAAHDRAAEAFLMILAVMKTVEDTFATALAFFHSLDSVFRLSQDECLILAPAETGGFRHGLLTKDEVGAASTWDKIAKRARIS